MNETEIEAALSEGANDAAADKVVKENKSEIQAAGVSKLDDDDDDNNGIPNHLETGSNGAMAAPSASSSNNVGSSKDDFPMILSQSEPSPEN